MKLKTVNTIILVLLVFNSFIITSCNRNISPTMKTVENLDIDKYLGTWYEIARFPHSFEKNLQGVTATYTKRKDGKITVLNQGYKNSLDGRLKQAKGKAYIPNPDIPGHLKVSFFLWFYADYYILELDTTNYQYALIGSSTPNYLWILSRTPQMDEQIFKELTSKAKALGYNLGKLEKVDQSQN
jgi:apolipoprotein D and lipocalin family protein